MSLTKNVQTVAIAGLLAFSTASVQAGEVVYDFAKVVDVDPITKTVRYSEPRQECWQEEVVHYQPGRTHHSSPTGAVLGGIIGAAIGNRVGHGKKNKKVGAVAGAMLGASIGHDVSRRHAHAEPGHRYTTTEERCETVRDYYEEERITGYQVTYKFRGNTYETRTKTHPGKKIKLRLNISPVL